MYLSSTALGQTVEVNISVTITNVIATTDAVFISAPAEVDLSLVTAVSIASVQSATVLPLSKQLIKFNPKFELSNPFPVNITLNQVGLPSYAATITSLFGIYIQRNTYNICSVATAFNIAVNSGSLTAALSASTLVAGVGSVAYNFSLSFTHPIDSAGKIGFYFNSGYFTISGGVTCQSSKSTNCNVASNSNNLVEVTGVTVSTTTQLDVVLSGLTNPSRVGQFPAVSITSYTIVSGTYHPVDSDSSSAYVTLTARPLLFADLNVTSSSPTVAATATYTLTLRNNNALPASSTVTVYFPVEVTFTTVICSVVCVAGIYNGTNGVQLQ